ncbi:hypothetical protein CYLTODRAFT_357070 [Cylindrobasidium torrendii FP15055 ss-10]|uniref:SAC domain-containing protein n=1 Tax=Cylindrobasidium torrendii FP15055 ss-10 TaxID=1314674 RepID=A0A0D7B511_9AGAR|nr:hypothetical protein CYLTODRAFT_357070 [Cylindrobasidium torrendii FP15055 ss-10]
MKKLFWRASKPPSPLNDQSSSPPPPTVQGLSGAVPHLQPRDVMPAVPSPSPYDRIAMLVTPEGLLLKPCDIVNSSHGVRIPWGKGGKVQETAVYGEWDGAAIIYGIVGILELFSNSYLLVVATKDHVGNLLEKTHSIHSLKGVTAIPLTEDAARTRINALASRGDARTPVIPPSRTLDTIGSSTSDPAVSPDPDNDTQPQPTLKPSPRVQFRADTIDLTGDGVSPAPSIHSRLLSDDASSEISSESAPGSPVINAITKRLSFWRKPIFPPSPERDGNNLKSPIPAAQEEEEVLLNSFGKEPQDVLASILPVEPVSTEEKSTELEDKIVRECVKEFTKGGMYFSYNFDLTRSMQSKRDKIIHDQKQTALLADLNALPRGEFSSNGNVTEPNPTLPLWRRVDRQYWWNEWLAKPFIDAGVHAYVLPIMQGYCQIASFTFEEEKIDYAIISRRSRDRAGLRYQRRGVDDDAHVANFVETETIVRIEQRERKTNTFSYVQIRGSIPLYWTQTGYGLKPAPALATDRTHEQNLDAVRRHFAKTVPKYGPHAIVNLAEAHGKEGALVQAYGECVNELASPDVQYNYYDFHVETKGMKYENISKLIDAMSKTFESQGFLWICDNNILSTQKGVFRVNCIDCLDRTNVVQSAFARHVLTKQLGALALLIEGKREEVDVAFNDVWANNGDAISRAYAGTSALKGDFTRTGKRDLSGMLNDGVNSLARMYTSTFSDWFSQAVIDFMLGHRTISVFAEFLHKLQSTDPRDLIRLSKIRAEAISTSVSRVLEDGESLLAGWTMFSPEDLNVTVGDKWEEKVLLLTVRAIYIVSYDYTLQKVKKYTRVPLGDLLTVKKGAYILSPLEEASRDPDQNAGFVLEWLNKHEETRLTSYSIRNSADGPSTPPPSPGPMVPGHRRAMTVAARSINKVTLSSILGNGTKMYPADLSDKSFGAFKMLPIDPTRARRATSDGFGDSAEEVEEAANCREAVDLVVERIRKACEDVGNTSEGFVKQDDVVGLAEAQRMTSMYAKMEYGVKRLLWLGG